MLVRTKSVGGRAGAKQWNFCDNYPRYTQEGGARVDGMSELICGEY